MTLIPIDSFGITWWVISSICRIRRCAAVLLWRLLVLLLSTLVIVVVTELLQSGEENNCLCVLLSLLFRFFCRPTQPLSPRSLPRSAWSHACSVFLAVKTSRHFLAQDQGDRATDAICSITECGRNRDDSSTPMALLRI